MNSFELVGIDGKQFEPLFHFSDEQLGSVGAVRKITTKTPGFPCRISLEDARPGEELLLLPCLHQPAASPYRASGPIVATGVCEGSAVALSSFMLARSA